MAATGTTLTGLVLDEIERINRENPDYCMSCGDVSKGNMHLCGACESKFEKYSQELQEEREASSGSSC